MKIYLLWQNENRGYDTYDSVVVAAEDEESARQIHPSTCSENPWSIGSWSWGSNWCSSPDDVSVEYIGTYEGEKTKPHIILASFNAG